MTERTPEQAGAATPPERGIVRRISGKWFALPYGEGSAVGPYSTQEQAQQWLDEIAHAG